MMAYTPFRRIMSQIVYNDEDHGMKLLVITNKKYFLLYVYT